MEIDDDMKLLDMAIAIADGYKEEDIKKQHKKGETYNARRWLQNILDNLDKNEHGIIHWNDIDGG